MGAVTLGIGLAWWQRQPDAEADAPTPVESGRARLVELGSTSCASCRAMQPVLEELRRTESSWLDVVSIDVFKRREEISRWQLKMIPTQVLLDAQGEEIERHLGFISAADLRAMFARHGILPRKTP